MSRDASLRRAAVATARGRGWNQRATAVSVHQSRCDRSALFLIVIVHQPNGLRQSGERADDEIRVLLSIRPSSPRGRDPCCSGASSAYGSPASPLRTSPRIAAFNMLSALCSAICFFLLLARQPVLTPTSVLQGSVGVSNAIAGSSSQGPAGR